MHLENSQASVSADCVIASTQLVHLHLGELRHGHVSEEEVLERGSDWRSISELHRHAVVRVEDLAGPEADDDVVVFAVVPLAEDARSAQVQVLAVIRCEWTVASLRHVNCNNKIP